MKKRTKRGDSSQFKKKMFTEHLQGGQQTKHRGYSGNNDFVSCPTRNLRVERRGEREVTVNLATVKLIIGPVTRAYT